MSHKTHAQSATRKRAAHPDFVHTFSIGALQDRVPLCFPVPEDVPPSPKRRYRSAYRYLGYEDLLDPTSLASLTCFQVALRLFDFSPSYNMFVRMWYSRDTDRAPSAGQVGSSRPPCCTAR